MPQRIQLHRTKGWRKPTDAVVVARPSRWGNPHAIGTEHEGAPLTRERAVELYREDLLAGRLAFDVATVRSELHGRDLACWCALDVPCHAEVLLHLANE